MALLAPRQHAFFPCPAIRPAPQHCSRRAPQYLHVVSSAAVCSGELLSYTQTAQPTQAPLSLEAHVSVRATTCESELAQAAQLRAEAYHEARQLYGRFTQSFIKQFAAQELRNLLRRVQAGSGSSGGAPPTWVTLVAVEEDPAAAPAAADAAAKQPCSQEGVHREQVQLQQHQRQQQSSYCQEWQQQQQQPGEHQVQQWQGQQYGQQQGQRQGHPPSGRCIGTLDLRLATEEQLASFRSKKQWRELAPQPGMPVAYLSNVAVSEASRGRGVGTQLVRSAKLAAKEALRAQWVLAHVQADNEPALQLYSKCGFVSVGEQEPTDGGILSSRLVLMSCRL